jgi:hypothetical protein
VRPPSALVTCISDSNLDICAQFPLAKTAYNRSIWTDNHVINFRQFDLFQRWALLRGRIWVVNRDNRFGGLVIHPRLRESYRSFLISTILHNVEGRLKWRWGFQGSWTSHMGTSIRRIWKEILNPRSGLHLRLFHRSDGRSEGSAGEDHLEHTSGSAPQLI